MGFGQGGRFRAVADFVSGGFTRPDQPDPLEPAIQTIALELAVRRGDAAMVELLLEFGADPNKKNAGAASAPSSRCGSSGPDARRR